MSTAGKVLVVLVMLVMAGWVVLISAVAQLNSNYGELVAKNDKTLETLTADVAKTTQDIAATIDKANREQADMVRDLAEVQARIVAFERHQSAAIEGLTRLKLQVANYESALATAVKALETRNAEEAQAKETLANKKAEIEKSKALNADLREQLAKLQDEFKRLLSENTSQLSDPTSGAAPRNVRTARSVPSL
jgi:chromosome segregation ATPase